MDHKSFHDWEPRKTSTALDASVNVFHIFVVKMGVLFN
jgi:hypothetical protein